MFVLRPLYLLCIPLLFSSSCKESGTKTKQTIHDSLRKERIEVETTSYGRGGGVTGSSPRLIKVNVSKYDYANVLFYHSYEETEYIGCMRYTNAWEVTAKTADGKTNELRLTRDTLYNLTFRNNSNGIDSVLTIPYRDLDQISWIDRRDYVQ